MGARAGDEQLGEPAGEHHGPSRISLDRAALLDPAAVSSNNHHTGHCTDGRETSHEKPARHEDSMQAGTRHTLPAEASCYPQNHTDCWTPPSASAASAPSSPGAPDHCRPTSTRKTSRRCSIGSSGSSSSSRSDTLFDLQHASLSPSPPSSSWQSPINTRRGSELASAAMKHYAMQDEGSQTLHASSTLSSGSNSPSSIPTAQENTQQSASDMVAAPFAGSTQALASVVQRTSQVAASILTVHQAVSISLYILVTLIASVTLISILVAGYGLTLADDLQKKIGVLGKKADQRRRKLLYDLEEWLRIANENLKKREASLEHGHPPPRHRRRSSSYPSAGRGHKTDHRVKQPSRSKDTLVTLGLYASTAYLNLPFSSYIFKSRSGSSQTSSAPRKAKSHPASRSRSRCSSPPTQTAPSFSNAFPQPNNTPSWSSSSKLPPRPPFSILLPSMLLALVLALVAFFKNGKTKKREC